MSNIPGVKGPEFLYCLWTAPKYYNNMNMWSQWIPSIIDKVFIVFCFMLGDRDIVHVLQCYVWSWVGEIMTVTQVLFQWDMK